MARQRYTRVDNSDDTASVTSTSSRAARIEERRRRSQRAENISSKLHALMWVGVAAALLYATEIHQIIVHADEVNRFWLNLGLMCSGVFVALTLYLVVYLPYIANVHLEWNVYCPRVIPTATIFGVSASICFNLALWPVYGLFTPLLLGVLFLGGLMVMHFIPSF